jgi:hypothetical protein
MIARLRALRRWRREFSHAVIPALRSVQASRVPARVTIWGFRNLEDQWVLLPRPLIVAAIEGPPPDYDDSVIRFTDRTGYAAVFDRDGLVLVPAGTSQILGLPMTEADKTIVGMVVSTMVGTMLGVLVYALGWLN